LSHCREKLRRPGHLPQPALTAPAARGHRPASPDRR
jgi:hypothetical protein